MAYFSPMRLDLDITALPDGMTYDGEFLCEMIGDRLIRYRIQSDGGTHRFPHEMGVSSLIVFRLSGTRLSTNASYSTWILHNNEDFTCIPQSSQPEDPSGRPSGYIL
jgi:hypothetical protein